MLSLKAFLLPVVAGTPRLTEAQRDGVVRAVVVALERVGRQPDSAGDLAQSALALARRIVVDALRSYPADRSCHACDFFSDGYCKHWNQAVPAASRDAGCPNFQDHGTPF